MFAYFWPLVLVVTANVFYNISSRSVPKACDAFMRSCAPTPRLLSFPCLDFW